MANVSPKASLCTRKVSPEPSLLIMDTQYLIDEDLGPPCINAYAAGVIINSEMIPELNFEIP